MLVIPHSKYNLLSALQNFMKQILHLQKLLIPLPHRKLLNLVLEPYNDTSTEVH